MTREKAIQRIKDRLHKQVWCVDDEDMKALSVVIPELTESEDERIYNEIMDFFKKNEKRCIVDNSYTRWIAWLEKQKEQKQTEYIPKFKVGDKVISTLNEHLTYDILEVGLINELGKPDYRVETFVDGKPGIPELKKERDIRLIDCQKMDSWAELIEQKPAEWSEDYREEDLRTRFAFYTYKDEDSVLYLSNIFVEETSRNKGFGTKILAAAEKVAETIGAITICLKVKQDSPANAWYRKHGYGYVAFEDGYDWLEKNLEYLKPQKSVAERSEEDEKMLNLTKTQLRILQSHLSHTHSGRMSDMEYSSQLLQIEQCVSWLDVRLKSLCPQTKQEWSKKDERILKGIIGKIDHDQTYGVSKLEMLSFLKRLRPQYCGNITMTEAYKMGKEAGEASHWKPNAQEIQAIKTAISVLIDERNFPLAAEHLENILKHYE